VAEVPRILPDDPGAAAAALPATHRRLLILGASGLVRRTLLGALAAGGFHTLLDANPALPLCGPPGAVSLGLRRAGAWLPSKLEPLCSLDTARFRLPLVSAVRRLAGKVGASRLLINASGLRAGIAGAELTSALIEAAQPDAIVLIEEPASATNSNELAASGLPVYVWRAPSEPVATSADARAKIRTGLWNRYLASGGTTRVKRSGLLRLGTPPPVDAAWIGHQVALGRADEWLGFGEVVAMDADTLELRLVGTVAGADRVLIRDAGRDATGALRTARLPDRPAPVIKQSSRAPLEIRAGPVIARLANGVTGDPLLQLRLRHRRPSLLFDVGECTGLSRRVLHTVTDLFLSHAHLDHVAGFVYLLRSRLSAELPPMRVHGPCGTRDHIAGFLAGVCWDRIGDEGPVFEVTEIDVLQQTRVTSWLRAGGNVARGSVTDDFTGTVVQTPDYTVTAAGLDHGIPVLCYALSLTKQHNVDPDRLAALNLPPGPWLGDLKAAISNDQPDTPITLPDGSKRAAHELAVLLLKAGGGVKIVYATDFADTPANRRTLTGFAATADVFFCEASFREADRAQAHATQHLTTTACGELARNAAVKRLVPFHFSKRYEGGLEAAYQEIEQSCGPVSVCRHPACPRPGSAEVDQAR
jgi:ribonuclease BN (tRNA processing enzyme)